MEVKKRTDFHWTEKPEPHSYRRKAILERYPEIQKLYVIDYWSAVYCTLTVLAQYYFAYLVSVYDPNWALLVFVSWAVSGTINHSITLAIHDLCHCVWFPKRWQNEWFSIFSNTATGFPSAISFKRYHLEHHTGQGVEGIDVDLPTNIEGRLFNNFFGKLFFLTMMPLFYAFRPAFVRPKVMSFMEVMNYIVVLGFDGFVFYYLGFKSFFYLVCGSLLGMSLHPIAGHFLAEHYVFTEGQETFSYYGIWNMFVYNTGYHNEHHDFPRVPGRLLPKVTATAPEFYENLHQCDSWLMTLVRFLFRKDMGCFSRTKRVRVGSKEAVAQCAKDLVTLVNEQQKAAGNKIKNATLSSKDIASALEGSVDVPFDESEFKPAEEDLNAPITAAACLISKNEENLRLSPQKLLSQCSESTDDGAVAPVVATSKRRTTSVGRSAKKDKTN